MFYRKGGARSKHILDFFGTAGRVYGFQALVHRGFESLDLRGGYRCEKTTHAPQDMDTSSSDFCEHTITI